MTVARVITGDARSSRRRIGLCIPAGGKSNKVPTQVRIRGTKVGARCLYLVGNARSQIEPKLSKTGAGKKSSLPKRQKATAAKDRKKGKIKPSAKAKGTSREMAICSCRIYDRRLREYQSPGFLFANRRTPQSNLKSAAAGDASLRNFPDGLAAQIERHQGTET